MSTLPKTPTEEPGQRVRDGRPTCRNCGARLETPYCGSCGQRADVSVPTLWSLFGELIDNLYNLDARVWRTLLPLFFRPGKLTREYLAGRRGFYLPPFRMYLVLSLVFFLLVSLFGAERPDFRAELAAEFAPSAGDAADDTDAAAARSDAPAGLPCDLGALAFLGPEVHDRLRVACEQIIADGGDSFVSAFVDRVPLLMFVIIPLAAAIMKLLYLFERRKYVEHLVFLLHFHAFFFLLATLQLLAARVAAVLPALQAPIELLDDGASIYLLVYLFLAMRRVYGESRLRTSFKYVTLLVGYVACMALTFAVGVVYTMLTL